MIEFLEKLAYFYLLPGYRLHILSVLWFILLFLYTFNKFWMKDNVKNLRFFMRTSILSFMLTFFIHTFYDLWVLIILFIGGNPGEALIIKPVVFSSRLTADLLFFTAIYWMLSYPKWVEDFPTLKKIKITGNVKFYAINIVILAWHLVLFFTGVLTMSRITDQLTRFYVGYLPMKILWGSAYWSVWKK